MRSHVASTRACFQALITSQGQAEWAPAAWLGAAQRLPRAGRFVAQIKPGPAQPGANLGPKIETLLIFHKQGTQKAVSRDRVGVFKGGGVSPKRQNSRI